MRVLVVAAMAWVAEPSAFADRRCSGDAVAVAVEALGGPKLADVGDRVRLDIERAPRGVEGRITYVTRSGETIGPRVVAASTCAELARSMALVIVMSLNDDATDEPSGAAPTASSDLTPGVVVAPAAPLGIEVRVGRRSSTSQFDVLLGAATDTTGHPALVLGSRWRGEEQQDDESVECRFSHSAWDDNLPP